MRCAILDDYQDVARSLADWSSIPELELTVFNDHVADRDAVAQALAPFELVVAMRERTPFDRPLLERLPALRLLVTTGKRNASIDLAACSERGVTVCGTAGWPGPAAELTWALIHALMRHIPDEVQDMRASARWQTRLGRSLHRATLGIVGMGTIGTHMAKVARAFDMNVLGYSRSFTAARASELGIACAGSLDALLATSDIITVHLALTTQTRGLIGVSQLARMKPDAYLVNTARGPIVDEVALIEALRARRIAGAALDVYDREPLPADHPLRTLPNALCTPHVGYVTRENYRVFFRDVVEDIKAWRAGAPLRVLTEASK